MGTGAADQIQPWRLGRAGAGGDRRAECAGGHAGAGLGYRQDRRRRQTARGLAVEAAAQLQPLYLDHRFPLVRKGNPKGHQDWGDLVGDGSRSSPEPQDQRRRARWNYLAAWAWAEKNGKDPKGFVADLSSMCRFWTPARAATDHLSPSVASAMCCWHGRTRPIWHQGIPRLSSDRRPLGQHPGRAAGRGRRQQHRQ